MENTEQDPGAEMTNDIIEWMYSRTKDNRLLITVLGKALAVLTVQIKPEAMTYARQRQLFTKAINDELKRAAKYIQASKR